MCPIGYHWVKKEDGQANMQQSFHGHCYFFAPDMTAMLHMAFDV